MPVPLIKRRRLVSLFQPVLRARPLLANASLPTGCPIFVFSENHALLLARSPRHRGHPCWLRHRTVLDSLTRWAQPLVGYVSRKLY